MAVMEYKGYAGAFEFDAEADLFHGEVLNTRAVLTFQGRSIDELRKALKGTVDDYIVWCKERGKEPEKPFSGKFVLRLEPELHRQAVIVAAPENKSLNTLVTEAIKEHIAAAV